MQLMRVETFQFSDPAKIPSEAQIAARAKKMADDLDMLRKAPLAEPYSGPALLSGRAAAVFFHEVLGHRVEGQRQRGREEGQTFTKKINEKIVPEFLSVADDPTLRTLAGEELSGWYRYDDEGIPAARVEVVKDGVLKNFLMGRLPVKNFSNSNGHGRAQAGQMPVGRQGNLIVSSSKTIPDAQLRARFIAEITKQGKPYGLYFEDIQGGFTLTSRALPQAFQVLPVMVWRVYADGRPDELVRGVDIVGTPLTVLTQIAATGDTTSVFNGICGAESGMVPVAAAAPAMLFSEMEVQKRKYGDTRPPILPPPPGATAAKEGAR
jgi:TldD protein